MKIILKIIGITLIFIFILWIVLSIFIIYHGVNKETGQGFPISYTIISFSISIGVTKYFSSKIWKKK